MSGARAAGQARFGDRSARGGHGGAGHVGHVDRQGGGAQVTVAVLDGVGEHVCLALGDGIGVGGVAVAAVLVQAQGAVLAHDREAGGVGGALHAAAVAHAHHGAARIPAVGTGLVVGQHACGGCHGQGRAFADVARVGLGFGSRVGDEHDQVVGLALVGRIGDGDREAVLDGVVASGVVLGRAVLLVAIADLAGAGVVASQRELAFGAGDDTRGGAQRLQLGHGECDVADLDAGQAFGSGDAQLAGDRLGGVLGDADVAGCGSVGVRDGHARHTIGVAVDGDRDGGGAEVAVGVPDRVAEGVLELLAIEQRVHAWVVVVELVGVAAVGLEHDRAVLAADCGVDAAADVLAASDGALGHAHDVGGIRSQAVGAGAADDVAAGAQPGVFRDGGRVGLGFGSRVGDLDDQVIAASLAGKILDGNLE